ncbi:MAG: hypothetical protein OQK75_02900 [Gammaproteobacteria bacterium]|nr:hypothetical protein [Gammaproteobacteria bacterium]MCW8986597.1 hypothetical protein [Gammaproteobacteria bacterium]MCW9029957.1 hypothetical protein [Gammaproteobacteria bacterium]
MKTLTIFINDQVAHEYDKETALDEQKLAFFNNMDADMEKGIKVQGELITSPDQKQRAKFVVLNLIKALQQDNDAIISASCAYLVNRLPALIEVHANDQGCVINIEFVDEH